MISIIICSREPRISEELSQNIEKTIGCPYELIVIDNSENTYSIFEAYNLGIQKSKGDFWCFMHDDILLHTKNWGVELISIFDSDNKIGLIGVAGAKMKTKMPSTWWDCPEDQKILNIIQHFPNNRKENWFLGFNEKQCEEVAVIDGVFMMGKKDNAIHFDERLKGYHNYDIYLSMVYKLNGYKIMVTQTVLLEHFSLGKINKDWYLSTLRFDNLLKQFLPLKIENVISKEQIKNQEFKNGMRFCNDLVLYNLKKEAMQYWFRLFFIKPISRFHYSFIKSLIN
ncbi:glycosyltransferase [Flavobacterium luminosum]|uniref:Glycosyltransferase family protein n=1 Tax=Flavobacterium luminosum TaxID=2949086 RepID=A0ABT0TNZ1_9FLAO|nr:glycosyltransferase [Flavobacterium sp. HXWNR70]MCL9809095.1 glycosyltransferase family protein [Flavobacterium sp. HXWNR70]